MWAAAYVTYVSAKVSACHITASLFLPRRCLLSPSIVVFFKWKRYDLLIMDLALSGYNSILLKPTMQGQLCGKISRVCQLIPVLPLSHTGRRLLNKHVNECRCLGRCNWLRGGGWSITWSRGNMSTYQRTSPRRDEAIQPTLLLCSVTCPQVDGWMAVNS